MKAHRIKFSLLAAGFGAMMILSSCERDYFASPPKPKQPKQTQMLEAAYCDLGPTSVTSPVWKSQDYVKVPLADISTKNLYGDGLLNMTGTYNGISDFNKGLSKTATMKAVYDATKVYIYVEWEDSRIDPSSGSYLFDGPADPNKADNNLGWTSQRNADQLALAFDINNAVGPNGAFSAVGCDASCHGKTNLTSGSVDIWNWNLALTDPLGFAADRVQTNSGLGFDAGTKLYQRNGTSDRSGPSYEWNGIPQTVTRNGKSVDLDPGFFLYSKNTTAFTGDPAAGFTVYKNAGCKGCHGDEGLGGGEDGDGPSFHTPGKMNRYSRQGFVDFATSSSHTGANYFVPISESNRVNLIATIRGWTGVPGYILSSPDGSSADVYAISNVVVSQINTDVPRTKYQVVLVRNLNTGNTDDAQFDPASGKDYIFGLALMDNDGKNHVGNLKQTLFFKPKQ